MIYVNVKQNNQSLLGRGNVSKIQPGSEEHRLLQSIAGVISQGKVVTTSSEQNHVVYRQALNTLIKESMILVSGKYLTLTPLGTKKLAELNEIQNRQISAVISNARLAAGNMHDSALLNLCREISKRSSLPDRAVESTLLYREYSSLVEKVSPLVVMTKISQLVDRGMLRIHNSSNHVYSSKINDLQFLTESRHNSNELLGGIWVVCD